MADKQMRFTISANDNASAAIERVETALGRLSAKLDELGRKDVKPKITLDSGLAQTRLDEFSAALRALSNTRVRIDADINGRAEVGELRRDLALLRNAKVKIDVTGADTALPSIERLRDALRELDGLDATARVDVAGNLPSATEIRAVASALRSLRDVGDVSIRIRITGDLEALAQLAAVRRAAGAANSTSTISVKANTSDAESALAKAAKAVFSLKGAIIGLGPTLLGSAVPAVASLTGSLVSLVGLAPIAAGALASIGLVGVALGAGLAHVSDALGPRDTAAQLKKVNEAMAQLAPSARATVTQIRELGGAWFKLRLDVQQKLFQGLSGSIREAGMTYIPTMKANLGGLSTEFNGITKNVLAFATTGRTVTDVNTIFDNTRLAVHNSALATNNLLGAFRDIAVVGTGFLPGLATGWTNVTQRFQTFISSARESGQLKVWIQGGIDTLTKLGSIAGNVGSALGSIWLASRASGADFLSTLDKVTGKLAELLSSATGQSALTSFFRESRAAVDAMIPGVQALATGILQMVKSFADSGGVQALGRTFSQLAETVGPLGTAIGSIAGGALKSLAAGGSLAVTALSPLIGLFGGLAGATSGVLGPLVAMTVAYKALGSAAVAGAFTSLSARLATAAPLINTYTAGLTGSLAAGNAAGAATTRLGTAVGKLGTALPLIGVGLIAAGTLYDQFAEHADDAASKVLSGSQSMGQAIQADADQIHKNQIEWLGGMNAQESYAQAAKNVTDQVNQQYAALSPMQKLQADVARGQADLNDAVAQYGSNSSQASTAGENLAGATRRLKDAQDGAAKAAQSQDDAEKALADTMASQISTALSYAQAVQRTADAHKAADDALKKSGAQSDEYKGAVLALAGAMSSQADAARQQGEALGGTAAGTQAYNTELLRTADLSTQAGRDAFGQLTAGLDSAGLAALSATAKMSGLRTEVVTLPDGRTVTVVVNADRGKLDSVKATAEEIAAKPYIGTIKMLAETDGARGAIIQTVALADGTQATLKISADGGPALLTVGQTKYAIDATTGTLKVLGDVAPGEASLAGLKLHVDSTTGLMTLDANSAPANAKTDGAKAHADTSIGTLTLDGNPTLANGKTTQAVTFANGSKGTVTLDANPNPATGMINGTVTYANGRQAAIQVSANTAGAQGVINGFINANNGRVITIYTSVLGSGGQASAGRLADGAVVRPMAQGGIIDGYADGGVRKLTTMRGDVAARVPANTWRVIGDRMQGAEYFLPDDDSPRTMAIGAEWARNRGLQLVRDADSGVARTAASSSVASSVARSAQGPRGGYAPVRTSVDLGPVVAALGRVENMLLHSRQVPSDVSAPIVSAVGRVEQALGHAITSAGDAADARRLGAVLSRVR